MLDSLTSLPSRRAMEKCITDEIQNAKKGSGYVGLALFNVASFQSVNDLLGFHAGDAVLALIAQRFCTESPMVKLIARVTGDEFAIVIAGKYDAKLKPAERKQEAALRIAALCEQVLAKFDLPVSFNGRDLDIDMNVGISTFPFDAGKTDEMLRQATLCVNVVKKDPKSSILFFDKSMSKQSQYKVDLFADMILAIDNRQFELYYQPIISTGSGKIDKAEALIRWNHPQKGFVSPGDFIPFAEDTGLIIDIGNWVFKDVADRLSYWKSLGHHSLEISLNVSPVQVLSASMIPQKWASYLETRGVSPKNVILEITERVLLRDDEDVMVKLVALRSLGFKIALDDFGTGNASIKFIKQFPLDYLKIDKSYVQNRPGVVSAIVRLAHESYLKTVSEGVETQEQLDSIKNFGCDFAQGYFFHKPLPADRFLMLLESSPNERLVSCAS